MPLTENQAKNAKPLERAYKRADSEGLFLLVQPNGAKLWRMKYRFAGKEKLLSFGAYPALGIAAAREKRRAATGWSAARLDWYKAQGCFTEIIRYQTRLFVPIEGAASVIARLASSA